MSIDAVLNIIGLVISIGGLLAAKLDKQAVLNIFLAALVITTGVVLYLNFHRVSELSKTEERIKQKLAHNRWTAERISDELQIDDKRLVRDALWRATDTGTLDEQRTECTSNDGTVLSTRVYFVRNAQ